MSCKGGTPKTISKKTNPPKKIQYTPPQLKDRESMFPLDTLEQKEDNPCKNTRKRYALTPRSDTYHREGNPGIFYLTTHPPKIDQFITTQNKER